MFSTKCYCLKTKVNAYPNPIVNGKRRQKNAQHFKGKNGRDLLAFDILLNLYSEVVTNLVRRE